MNPKNPTPIKIKREVVWRSPDGLYVVVKGPFPQGFQRSADASSVAKARKRVPGASLGVIVARGATTESNRWAMTLAALVTQTHNEWGEEGL